MTPNQAIAAAQANANNNANVIPATATQAVALPQTSTAAPSMAALMQQGFAVDHFVKVSENGLLLSKDATAKQAVDTARVIIDMTEGFGFKPLYTVSYGDPVQYAESYDGVTSTKGDSWANAVATARAVDPRATPFQTVKVGMELAQDTQNLKAGVTLGLTFTRTGITNWVKLYQEVIRSGLNGKKVEVILGYKVGEKKGYRNWGIPTFELVGEYYEHGGE